MSQDDVLAKQSGLAEWLTWGLLLLAAVLSGMGIRTVCVGDTVTSRLATVFSLTQDGTWYIDRPLTQPPNPFEQRTVDKVWVNGRLISSKPPVLTLLMTGEYLVFHRLFGWGFDDIAQLKRLLQCMNFSLVVLAYSGTLVWFALILRLVMANAWPRLAVLASLAFGTQLFGFSAQLNNHVPGACMLMMALYFVLGLCSEKHAPAPWRFFLFGFSASLVYTLDMPLTIFAAPAGLYLLYRFPKQAVVWGGLGALPALAIHFGVMMTVTGSLLPVQVNRAMYLYESSPWRNPLGIDALNEPKGKYLFHMTFGRHGSFMLYPVLLMGLAGAIRALVRRNMPWRGYVLTGLAAFVILTAYYVFRTNNYGGEAYGFRWHIGAMPVLLLMGAPVVDGMRGRWKWGIMVILLAISAYSAWECFQMPWQSNREWICRLFLGPSV
ncbi:MAG TPA: hypothetical protein PLI09_18690 [Candidatus Hydrogenedentes bacterium]|nr:hypothetical protein [Candidatus Hydrogenedentota bacterium]